MALALGVCGLIGVVRAVATSPLSDAGLMQGARWLGFRGHLKGLAMASDVDGAAPVGPRSIVYAVALGLGAQWSRYLKKHPDMAPPWFVAAGDDPGAFAAFVGSGTAASAGHDR